MGYPCSGCTIVQGLIKEIIQKVIKQTDVEYEEVILKHPSEIYNIDGIEVEKLPLILINDEQVTAGNLISTKELIKLIENS
jgi:deoxycytidylate deaminase